MGLLLRPHYVAQTEKGYVGTIVEANIEVVLPSVIHVLYCSYP